MDRATDRASVLSHNLVLLRDRSDKKKKKKKNCNERWIEKVKRANGLNFIP